jgi:hypothetical protein
LDYIETVGIPSHALLASWMDYVVKLRSATIGTAIFQSTISISANLANSI